MDALAEKIAWLRAAREAERLEAAYARAQLELSDVTRAFGVAHRKEIEAREAYLEALRRGDKDRKH